MTKCDGDGSDCHNDYDDDDGNGDYWLFFFPEDPEVIALKRKYK